MQFNEVKIALAVSAALASIAAQAAVRHSFLSIMFVSCYYCFSSISTMGLTSFVQISSVIGPTTL